MAEAPLVSVITIFLNAERFIEEAIESVLGQTHGNWELLLVDDGSSDASTGISQRYADGYPHRIRYLEHAGCRNLGTGPSRNLGLAQARGRYVAFLDSDDVWLPPRLERHVEILERRPDVAMVYGPALYWFSWPGAPAGRGRDYVRRLYVKPDRCYEAPQLLRRFLAAAGAVPDICSLLIRREIALRLGGFEDQFRGIFEDQTLIAKVALSQRIYVIDECLDRYRQHPDSCCARAIESGEYHPKTFNQGELFYLQWLAGYLNQQNVTDKNLLRILYWRLLPYRRTNLAFVMRGCYRVKKAASSAWQLLAKIWARCRGLSSAAPFPR